MSGGIGRRRFLVAGALTSSGIGLQLAAFPTKANAQSAEPIEVDFCVVGAGYAGLTAALRLQQVGRSVGVLEARDRVGGRIWSALLSDGTPIDLGGQWVGPRQRRIHALAEEMKVPIKSPVYQITQDATSVEVVSDEIKVRARRVIVTVPRTLADGIEFDPILPADAAQLIQRMPMGSVIKATLVYDEAFWRQDGLSGASLNPSSPVSATADGGYEPGRDRPGLMVAFVGGESARVLGRMTPARRQDVIVGELVKLFGPKAAQLSQNIVYQPTGLPYIDHNWSEEEWTRGDYAAYLPPGVLTGYGAEIRKPFGRIHWAGTETATEWNIYMDGAVQSGERAAAEVLAAD